MESFITRYLFSAHECNQAQIITAGKISDLIQDSVKMNKVAKSGVNFLDKRLSMQGRQFLYRESLLNAIISLQETHRLRLTITPDTLSQINDIILDPEPEFDLDTV